MPTGRRAPRPLPGPRQYPLVKGVFVMLADWPEGTQRPPQVGGGGRRLGGGGREGGVTGHRGEASGPKDLRKEPCAGGRERGHTPSAAQGSGFRVAVSCVHRGPDLPQLRGAGSQRRAVPTRGPCSHGCPHPSAFTALSIPWQSAPGALLCPLPLPLPPPSPPLPPPLPP